MENDGSIRLTAALLLRKELTPQERGAVLQDLLNDGLTMADIVELYPGCFGSGMATKTGTDTPTVRFP